MKKQLFLLFCLLCVTGIHAQELFIGTYNIRYDNDGDRKAGNGWDRRSPVICDMLNFEEPDIFGTQEGRANQIHDLQKGLKGYDYIGVGRDDGKEGGEYSAIFYKKEKLTKIRSGNFWLNETPEKPKLGWDAICIRICTWGEFMDNITKLKFYFFNLHMDHIGTTARRESAKLVIRKIKEITGGNAPVILTGDFNVDQNNEIYRTFLTSGMLKDSYSTAEMRFAENGTFNNFSSSLKTSSRIDHVFVSPKFEVKRYGVLTNGYWTATDSMNTQNSSNASKEITFKEYTRRTPSDHYPVLVKIRYKK